MGTSWGLCLWLGVNFIEYLPVCFLPFIFPLNKRWLICVLVTQSCPTHCDPMDYSSPGSCPWNSPGKNTRVGCHFLLQEIFPTQGSNPGLLHSRQIFYWLSYQGSLRVCVYMCVCMCIHIYMCKLSYLEIIWLQIYSYMFSSVRFSCSVMSNSAIPWTAKCQASLSITNSWSFLKLMSIESLMPSNQLILCHPLLLPPSTFPSIRVFWNESVLHIRWPKYWSFSFSIDPSNEYSGLYMYISKIHICIYLCSILCLFHLLSQTFNCL